MKPVKDHSKVLGLHMQDLDLDNLEIYLMGREELANEEGSEPGVEYTMSNRFIKNLNLCLANSKNGRAYRPILVHMKTNGGDWNEGMAIYDAIRSVPNKVTIVNYSHARSMSSIIFQAAHRRVMMPHSSFMFHRGTWEFGGTIQEVESNWNWDKKDDVTMCDIYAGRMKESNKFKSVSKTKIKAWLNEQMMKRTDVFLSPEGAIQYGLADEVFTSWKNVRK